MGAILYPFQDIWQHPGAFLIAVTCGEGAPDIGWVEAGDAAKHPTYKTSPTTKDYLAPDFHSVLVEKPGLRELMLRAAPDARRAVICACSTESPPTTGRPLVLPPVMKTFAFSHHPDLGFTVPQRREQLRSSDIWLLIPALPLAV